MSCEESVLQCRFTIFFYYSPSQSLRVLVLLHIMTLLRGLGGEREPFLECNQPGNPSSSSHSLCLRHTNTEHWWRWFASGLQGPCLVTERGVTSWMCKLSVNVLVWVKIGSVVPWRKQTFNGIIKQPVTPLLLRFLILEWSRKNKIAPMVPCPGSTGSHMSEQGSHVASVS